MYGQGVSEIDYPNQKDWEREDKIGAAGGGL